MDARDCSEWQWDTQEKAVYYYGKKIPTCVFEEIQDLEKTKDKLTKAYESQLAAQVTLFDAIQHGTEGHRRWLKARIAEHFAKFQKNPYN